MSEKKRIVILGAGFAGIYTYLSLKKYLPNFNDLEIVLVDQKNYFLFVPMIHEVATGNLEASSVIQPIRQVIDACQIRFIEGRVAGVDLDKQEVGVTVGSRNIEVTYNYLVLALGSTHNFFGVPGADNCLVLKDLKDAQRIRSKIISAFETANTIENLTAKEKLLTFIIIGGGPTGVELAGELADLLNHEIKRAYPQLYKLASIHLIHAGSKLVEQVDDWFHVKTKSILEKMGVQLHLQHRVTGINERGACFDETEWIESSNIFWTAGVKAIELDFQGQMAGKIKYNERDGRISVNQNLQIPDIKNVFVAGDQMCLTDKETGQPYPMRAQFAAREGQVVGENITKLVKADLSFRAKPPDSSRGKVEKSYNTQYNETLRQAQGDTLKSIKLKEFKWQDRGFIVSLGRGGALAQAYGLKISGPLAWWLYRTAYLFKLVGARAKLKTAFDWTMNLFLPRDISKF